jgi:hypothetical protein
MEDTMRLTIGIVAVAALAVGVPMGAQWLTYPSPDIPRMKDGKANLSARSPKLRDGKPDLSGVWRAAADPQGTPEGVENEIFPRYFINIAKDLKPQDVALRPTADILFKERLQDQGKNAPEAHCVPVGVPGINTFPSPFKIVQMPRLIVMLYEENTTYRQIFMDGRPLPPDPNPSFMGYSIGRWEADTLVVESVGFRNEGWLDRMGHPHSDQLHLTERFRRLDFGHLSLTVTIDDPATYAKPLTYTQPAVLLPDTDLLEYFCTDNEKDIRHFK